MFYARILLLLFIFIGPVSLAGSFHRLHRQNEILDEARREYIAANGSEEGFYGDCSGASTIVPVFTGMIAMLLSLWALITLILSLFRQLSAKTTWWLTAINGVCLLPLTWWIASSYSL